MTRLVESINWKIRIVALVGIMITIVIAYFLTEIAVLNREYYLGSAFTDVKFLELMNSLPDKNVVSNDKDGNIIVDEEKLKLMKLNRATHNRVLRHIKYYSIREGKLSFDKSKVSIGYGNKYASTNLTYQRGTIYDRDGKVIAQTVLDEKSLAVQRLYPQGEPFFHPVGVYSDTYNNRGIEDVFNNVLKDGYKHEPLYRSTGDPVRKILDGDDITLTLSSGIQSKVFAIQKKHGFKSGVVILDAKTAEIIAISSYPSFDPNMPAGDDWLLLTKDENRPGDNRALLNYPPGSIFKIIVTAALIENGYKDLKFACLGNKTDKKRPVKCLKLHGTIDLTNAFEKSCNQYFAQAGIFLGKNLQDTAEKFGFNSQPLLFTPQIDGHSIASQGAVGFPNDFAYIYNPKLIGQASIGQNFISASPLVIASAVQTIVNKGQAIEPYLIREISSADAKAAWKHRPKSKTVVKPSTAEQIKKFMRLVMKEGTGRNLKIYKEGEEISLLGKTGSAERFQGDDQLMSWFAGAAPADEPLFVIAVVAEKAGFGALGAGPMAMEMLAAALNGK